MVDCTGLENRRTERYREFESLPLRNNKLLRDQTCLQFWCEVLVSISLLKWLYTWLRSRFNQRVGKWWQNGQTLLNTRIGVKGLAYMTSNLQGGFDSRWSCLCVDPWERFETAKIKESIQVFTLQYRGSQPQTDWPKGMGCKLRLMSARWRSERGLLRGRLFNLFFIIWTGASCY